MNGKAMRSVDSISESEEINDHPDNHTMDSSSDGRSLLSMASFDNCSILSMELNEVRTRSVVNKIDLTVSRPASDVRDCLFIFTLTTACLAKPL